jgi:hypothetical protein
LLISSTVILVGAVVVFAFMAWLGYGFGRKFGKEKRLSIIIRPRPDGNYYLRYCWGQSDLFSKVYTETVLTKDELKDKLNKLVEGTKWEAS